MRKLKAQGIPVIAVMITGRPLYVNTALNLADAFVVTWLPGSEGGGLADVIVGDSRGTPRFDFSGQLPAAWPRTPDIAEGALYDLGFGLKYTSAKTAWTDLPEVDVSAAGDSRVWFAAGAPAASWALLIRESINSEETRLTTIPAEALSGRVKVTAENFLVQEGARRFTVESGQATTVLRNFEAIDLDKETNADVMLLVTAKVWKSPKGAALGSAGNDSVGLATINLPVSDNFVRYGIPLKCMRSKGADMRDLTMPFVLQTSGPADYAIGEVRLGSDAEQVLPCQ
jgi:beta-glucosidase